MKNVRIITTARAIIFNEKNELLLVKNDGNQPWFTPGGWLDGFETLEETCIREVFEELGLKIRPLKLLKIDYYRQTAEENVKWKENINKIEHYFLCEISSGKVKQGGNFKNLWNDKDVGNTGFVRFFSKEELRKNDFAPKWLEFVEL